jgi:Lon protease-like protein
MVLPWVTLFPGSLLPLFIFEERYREMIRLALDGNRMFAIAHSEEEGSIAPLGGLGILRACVTNDDGTSNLILQGISRVAFSGFQDSPHPQADIHLLCDTSTHNVHLEPLRCRIMEACSARFEQGLEAPKGFQAYLQSLTAQGAFTDMVASALVTDPAQRRTLLETIDLESRMSLLLDSLQENSEAV